MNNEENYNVRAPLSAAEQMRDKLYRISNPRLIKSCIDPFGTGDYFDVFRTIFDSPFSPAPDKNLINWLITAETSNVYPYDYYIDTEYQTTSSKDGEDKVNKVTHVFEIPVAGFEKDEIKVSTVLNKLRVTLGNIDKTKTDNSSDNKRIIDDSSNDEITHVRYFVKKSIKRNFVELQWHIKGLEPKNVWSGIRNGLLTIMVQIPIEDQKPKNAWTEVKVDSSD